MRRCLCGASHIGTGCVSCSAGLLKGVAPLGTRPAPFLTLPQFRRFPTRFAHVPALLVRLAPSTRHDSRSRHLDGTAQTTGQRHRCLTYARQDVFRCPDLRPQSLVKGSLVASAFGRGPLFLRPTQENAPWYPKTNQKHPGDGAVARDRPRAIPSRRVPIDISRALENAPAGIEIVDRLRPPTTPTKRNSAKTR